jgi:ABC-type antimicrobial peptide transport system permease subunit
MPEITEIVDVSTGRGLLSPTTFSPRSISSWDDKPIDAGEMAAEFIPVPPDFFVFYELQLAAGEMFTDADTDEMIMINESLMKALGWHDAVGKRIDDKVVKGVIKNIYITPTIEAKPLLYNKARSGPTIIGFGEITLFVQTFVFKYQEGTWESAKEKIMALKEKEYPNAMSFSLVNAEEAYKKLLQSENALMKLLSFVSAICLLICIFGFVSLVSLTCEERRKSIAIRKVHGATVGNILGTFAKEYFLLLLIGAAIAFPIGYIIMKHWLEQYMKQTAISAWIYLSIIFVLALIIVLCVGWRVYKASNENPAEVVKSE